MTDLDRIRAAGMPTEAREKMQRHIDWRKANHLWKGWSLVEDALAEATAGQVAALERLSNRKCAECDCREGSSHYCLLWTINTPDEHYCRDWTARLTKEQP